MPIVPVPPPPAPYVAPDLRPVSSKPTASLTFLRERSTGRVLGTRFTNNIWIRTEDAPFEVRFHRRGDGTIWAEQAFYADGDRGTGTASDVAGARLEPVDGSALRSMGSLRSFVRFTVRDSGGRAVRRWSTFHCAQFEDIARLDLPGSPATPTYPSAWDGCEASDSYSGVYVLGRMYGIDRGWATAPRSYSPRIRPLPAGTYSLDVEVNPWGAFADNDPSNDKLTISLRVGVGSWQSEQRCEDYGCTTVPVHQGIALGASAPSGRMLHRHPSGVTSYHRANATPDGRREPSWLARMLRRIELRAARERARAEAGPQPRAGETTPPPAGVDLPDLRSAPSYGIGTHQEGRKDLLDFGALEWNAGPGRLEVEAFREEGTSLDAYQVFYKDGARQERQARGAMIWHAAPGHNHFHFESFARYRLARMDGTVIRDSGKNSWCIVDTDLVDTTLAGVPAAGIDQRMGDVGGCGADPEAIWARLSLSVGSGDYYTQSVAGQSFDISALPNGPYRIMIEVNPSGVIAEASYTNNVSARTVVLGGRPGRRTVTPRPVPVLNESTMFWGPAVPTGPTRTTAP